MAEPDNASTRSSASTVPDTTKIPMIIRDPAGDRLRAPGSSSVGPLGHDVKPFERRVFLSQDSLNGLQVLSLEIGLASRLNTEDLRRAHRQIDGPHVKLTVMRVCRMASRHRPALRSPEHRVHAH
jgi:hypothetical protein